MARLPRKLSKTNRAHAIRTGRAIARDLAAKSTDDVASARRNPSQAEAILDDLVTDVVTTAGPDSLDNDRCRNDSVCNEVWFDWYYAAKDAVYLALGLSPIYGEVEAGEVRTV